MPKVGGSFLFPLPPPPSPPLPSPPSLPLFQVMRAGSIKPRVKTCETQYARWGWGVEGALPSFCRKDPISGSRHLQGVTYHEVSTLSLSLTSSSSFFSLLMTKSPSWRQEMSGLFFFSCYYSKTRLMKKIAVNGKIFPRREFSVRYINPLG